MVTLIREMPMRGKRGSADGLRRQGCSALAALLACVLLTTGSGYPAAQAIKTFEGVHGIEFVAVPGGSFRPGYIEGGDVDRYPAVTVDAFEMSETEITNTQFCAYLNEAVAAGDVIVSFNYVIGTTGKWGGKEYYQHTARFNNDNRSFITYNGSVFAVDFGKEKWPVVYVTWYGAKAFVEHYGYDLPTEIEWEFAAKGGAELAYGTDDGIISSSKANYMDFKGHPVDVASYSRNPFGLFDMTGNVWEWCREPIRAEEGGDGSGGVTGKLMNAQQHIRGGSWHSPATSCTTTFSRGFTPDFMYFTIGFRVVRR